MDYEEGSEIKNRTTVPFIRHDTVSRQPGGQHLQRDLRCRKDPHRDRHDGAAMPVEASNHLRMLWAKATMVSVMSVKGKGPRGS